MNAKRTAVVWIYSCIWIVAILFRVQQPRRIGKFFNNIQIFIILLQNNKITVTHSTFIYSSFNIHKVQRVKNLAAGLALNNWFTQNYPTIVYCTRTHTLQLNRRLNLKSSHIYTTPNQHIHGPGANAFSVSADTENAHMCAPCGRHVGAHMCAPSI